jgi:hypothetical protein
MNNSRSSNIVSHVGHLMRTDGVIVDDGSVVGVIDDDGSCCAFVCADTGTLDGVWCGGAEVPCMIGTNRLGCTRD